MRTAIEEAGKALDRKILYYKNDQVLSGEGYAKITELQPALGFKDSVIPGAANSVFSAKVGRPQDFRFSKLRLDAIMVKSRDAASGVILTITHGATVTILDPIDLPADEVFIVYTDLALDSLDFTISADLSGLVIYEGERLLPGCTPCKTRQYGPLQILAADGISARVTVQCSEEAITCWAYENYPVPLGEVLRYRAGAYLNEVLMSSIRANPTTQWADTPFLQAQREEWEGRAKAIMAEVMPNIWQSIQMADKYCLQCGGWVARQKLS